jgi:hypothetical protein
MFKEKRFVYKGGPESFGFGDSADFSLDDIGSETKEAPEKKPNKLDEEAEKRNKELFSLAAGIAENMDKAKDAINKLPKGQDFSYGEESLEEEGDETEVEKKPTDKFAELTLETKNKTEPLIIFDDTGIEVADMATLIATTGEEYSEKLKAINEVSKEWKDMADEYTNEMLKQA